MTDRLLIDRELLEELRDAANESMNATTRQHQIDHFAGLIAKADALLSSQSPAGVDADHVEDVRAMVADPSPAGVDGLEVVGWYRMDDRKAITPYPSVCATWHKMGVKVGAAYSDSAHVIIDGLRGEVGAQRIKTCTALKERNDAREERDQQAQRIGELEGLLRDLRGWVDETARVYRHNSTSVMLYRIDAALSAGK